MYKKYFGMKRSPFSIAPDPRYLYMSAQHREAMAHLLYGVRSEGGFVLLTGEIGTGKTTICRRFLETLAKNIVVAFIINPTLSVPELLAAVCDEFGISYPRKTSIKALVDRINTFLLDLNAKRKKAILIIDEAQNLRREVLEQIRLLTNLETNERKLLQIILIGQPELRDNLARPELRQLSQRIAARCHLDALSKPDVIRYVNHRIAIARGIRPQGAYNPLLKRTDVTTRSHAAPRAKPPDDMPEAGGVGDSDRQYDRPPLRPTPESVDSPASDPGFLASAQSSRMTGPPSSGLPLFSQEALNSLYAYSGGIPRLINLICDRALLGAFVQQKQIVDRTTLIKAAVEVLGSRLPETRRRWKIALAAIVLICAWLGLLYLFFNGFGPPRIFGTRETGQISRVHSLRDIRPPAKPADNPGRQSHRPLRIPDSAE